MGACRGSVNVGIVDRALFLESDDSSRQGRLSLEVAKLSEGFYDALKKHPIPMEEAASGRSPTIRRRSIATFGWPIGSTPCTARKWSPGRR